MYNSNAGKNTDKESCRIRNWEWKTNVVVKREGNSTPSGLEMLDETEMFRGDENSLLMQQSYTRNFHCAFQLRRYPFDTQVIEEPNKESLMILFQTCSIEMAMGTLDRSTVTLIPENLTMRQNVDMPIFLITDWKLKNKTTGKGLSMVVLLKRKITSEMMTTYFPSLLLIAITFATTFFKPFFFEAALSVNLTTMLVMTTIFISKMKACPPPLPPR